MTDDDWTTTGRNILDSASLKAVEDALEQGPVIVEHWHYRRSRGPDRIVFDDLGLFEDYLTHNTRPGDALHVWSFPVVCKDDNTLASGKCPDGEGRVPTGGAY